MTEAVAEHGGQRHAGRSSPTYTTLEATQETQQSLNGSGLYLYNNKYILYTTSIMLDTTKSDTIMSFTKVNIRFDQKTLITLYCKLYFFEV